MTASPSVSRTVLSARRTVITGRPPSPVPATSETFGLMTQCTSPVSAMIRGWICRLIVASIFSRRV